MSDALTDQLNRGEVEPGLEAAAEDVMDSSKGVLKKAIAKPKAKSVSKAIAKPNKTKKGK